MDFLKKYLKGLVIGIALIIPGVSGGTLAVLLNVYDSLVHAVSNITKEFKKSFAFLFPVGLGMITSVIALIYPITLMLQHAPLLLIFLFTGLIIGGIPPLFDKVKNKKPNISCYISCILALLLAVALGVVPVIGKFNNSVSLSNVNFGGYVLLFFIGVFAACALTIPGVSGSMILLVCGYYTPIMELVKTFLKNTLQLELSNFLQNFAVLSTFGLGIIVGFFLTSKMMDILLRKFSVVTYFAVIGFVIGSIFSLGYNTDTITYYKTANWWHYVVGSLLLIGGIVISTFFVKLGKKFAKDESPAEKPNSIPETLPNEEA